MCGAEERRNNGIFSRFPPPVWSNTHLHLFVPTLLLPANQGSRMKMQRNVSLLLIPLKRAGLSESRRPLRNQCTVCFFRELFRVILLTKLVLHYHAGNGQLGGFEDLFSCSADSQDREETARHTAWAPSVHGCSVPPPHWLLRFFYSPPPIGWEPHVARLDVTLPHCCSLASPVPFPMECLQVATSFYWSICKRHRPPAHLYKTVAGEVDQGGGQFHIYVRLCPSSSPNTYFPHKNTNTPCG